ncbi:MAG: formate dehydrogenase accessory sulfurtransferase FdhD [Candidatus Omnitrophota bacterium]|nr:formate dehydrogenase accessory sulfurtransferase FdhD [Candidatus Omnitrophota bacterium]
MEVFKVIKIKAGAKEAADDLVVEEVPFTLNIGDKELVTLLCMPADLEDLAAGFLFTSGLIRKIEDIKKIVINREQWVAYIELAVADTEMVFKRLYTSGCGRGTLFYSAADLINRVKNVSDFKIEAVKISSLMADFQKKSEIYLKTGGAHSAALADNKGILIFKEDIGRHNAIDKVIGQRLREGGSFENKIMVTSGRISSEVLLKTQKCRIPVVVSKSAPTNQAIRLAKDMGVTLAGFTRGNRLNIYSAEERID